MQQQVKISELFMQSEKITALATPRSITFIIFMAPFGNSAPESVAVGQGR
jgi:hypothetical protein